MAIRAVLLVEKITDKGIVWESFNFEWLHEAVAEMGKAVTRFETQSATVAQRNSAGGYAVFHRMTQDYKFRLSQLAKDRADEAALHSMCSVMEPDGPDYPQGPEAHDTEPQPLPFAPVPAEENMVAGTIGMQGDASGMRPILAMHNDCGGES